MKTVLMIDDNPEVLNMLFECITLEDDDIKCLLAMTLDEADQLLHTIKFDVVICDQNLGEGKIPGAIFSCKVKAYQPQAKFILMSGDMPNVEHDLLKNISMFLPKPFDIEQLIQVINGTEIKRSA